LHSKSAYEVETGLEFRRVLFRAVCEAHWRDTSARQSASQTPASQYHEALPDETSSQDTSAHGIAGRTRPSATASALSQKTVGLRYIARKRVHRARRWRMSLTVAFAVAPMPMRVADPGPVQSP